MSGHAEGYVETLAAELAAAGIRGRCARRITAEIADHLTLDPEADLGAPDALARQFADELGTSRARSAAAGAFAALAVAGLAMVAALLVSSAEGVRWPSVPARSPILATAAAVAVVIGSQLAFVTGVLAAVRALRLRGELVIPRGEARMIVRRSWVALGSGLVSMAGMALLAAELRQDVPGWVTSFLLAGAGAGAIALLAAAPAVLSAARLEPVAGGACGDLFDDFGPLVPAPLSGRPWRLALAVAAVVAIVIAAAGALQSDGYDGIARGLADALACLAGFALLGRYLGLRA